MSFFVSTGCNLNKTFPVGVEGHRKVVLDDLVNRDLGGGEKIPIRLWKLRLLSILANHALAQRRGWFIGGEKHTLYFYQTLLGHKQTHFPSVISHTCQDVNATVAFVVTEHKVRVRIRLGGRRVGGCTGTPRGIFGLRCWNMRPWAGSWRWITLVLLAWGTLLFYIGGHLVRDSEHPERSSRELSKILAKLERLKQQNEDLRRMAESLR